MNKKLNIGFSEIGGIFIGKGIQSDFHQHYAITILLSFGESFTLSTKENAPDKFEGAIIQKNIGYSLQSGENDQIAFIHIVPYSKEGMQLYNKNAIQKLSADHFQDILKEIKNWQESPKRDQRQIQNILTEISKRLGDENSGALIDPRILNSFALIMKNESEKLSVNEIAQQVHLSVSHFNRLFKKETGLTFRKFVLHSKLIKSIQAMYENNSLTEASFIGGFSDQPHLTRTFKNNFGIKPSVSLK